MLRLLEFLYKRRLFGLFLILESISFWLLFSFNNRYNTYYLNSSNRVTGEITTQVNSISSYFNLDQINADLASENQMLRNQLAQKIHSPDTSEFVSDSIRFAFRQAEVINASYLRAKNFLTLRVHPEDSIEPGMGVVGYGGVVGVVKSTSSHFATVTSLLNSNLMISSRVKSNGAISTVQWDGNDPLYAELKYVPRHLKLDVGDTVVTSGFDTIFPEGHPIGIVSESSLRNESAFYDAKVRLGTDFTTIHSAYVVKIMSLGEINNLEEEME